MSYFNRNKWWAIAFLLLIALNVATLGTFWLVKERRNDPPPQQQSGVVSFLVQELSFDSIQKQKLVNLVNAHRQRIREVRKNSRDAKDAFFSMLKENEIADSAIENAAKESAHYDAETDVLTFKHFRDIRNLCTPAQKEKFDQIIQQVLRMLAPPQPGKPQGPPHDGPPPGEEGQRPPPPPAQ